MPDIRHMHSDLVSPAGFQTTGDIGKLLKTLQYLHMGQSPLPAGHYRHLQPVLRVSSDRRVYSHFIFLQDTVNDRMVDAVHGMLL